MTTTPVKEVEIMFNPTSVSALLQELGLLVKQNQQAGRYHEAGILYAVHALLFDVAATASAAAPSPAPVAEKAKRGRPPKDAPNGTPASVADLTGVG